MLVKRNPVLPNMFDELLRDLSINTNEMSNFKRPAVNIVENEDNFMLFLAAPGLTKKDFHINIEENILTISADRKVENEEKKENFTLKEYSFDSFKRNFNLPKDSIAVEKVAATYKNGELVLTLPKMEIVKEKAKLIEVK